MLYTAPTLLPPKQQEGVKDNTAGWQAADVPCSRVTQGPCSEYPARGPLLHPEVQFRSPLTIARECMCWMGARSLGQQVILVWLSLESPPLFRKHAALQRVCPCLSRRAQFKHRVNKSQHHQHSITSRPEKNTIPRG